jgi:hypothetical protein
MKQALDALARPPAERQDDLAGYILELVRDPRQPYALSPRSAPQSRRPKASSPAASVSRRSPCAPSGAATGCRMRIVYAPRALADLVV